MQDRHQHLETTVKELRRSTAEEFQFDRDALRSHVVKVEGRMIEVMSRQDDFAAALEHFCQMLEPGMIRASSPYFPQKRHAIVDSPLITSQRETSYMPKTRFKKPIWSPTRTVVPVMKAPSARGLRSLPSMAK